MLWQKQGTRWDKRNCGPTCIWTTSQACLVRLAELHCRQSLFFSLPSKCSLIETLEPTGLGNSVSCLLVTFEFYFSTGKVVNPDPDGYSKRQLLSWRRKQNQNRLPHHALRSSTPWPFAHRSGDQRLCHGSVALTLTQLPALEKIGAFMLGLYVSVDG